jgi:hypothetical protein
MLNVKRTQESLETERLMGSSGRTIRGLAERSLTHELS